MAREAKDLAQQRAALEAALAAEGVDAQGHGYTPTPLATPKAVQVGSVVLSPSYMPICWSSPNTCRERP